MCDVRTVGAAQRGLYLGVVAQLLGQLQRGLRRRRQRGALVPAREVGRQRQHAGQHRPEGRRRERLGLGGAARARTHTARREQSRAQVR
jgi:hypothetical protein